MSAIAKQFEANQFPLPFSSFSVVSAEMADCVPFSNELRTAVLRADLQERKACFIEARGIYQGKSEVCFVILGNGHGQTARALAEEYDQVSWLEVYDTRATECYTSFAGNESANKHLPLWRIVNPLVDPCLSIPGMPSIQFYSK